MNIVLCDDDKKTQEEVRQLVHRIQYEIGEELVFFAVSSGDELLRFSTEYQILILDIEMPGMDGIQTGRYLRAQNNGCEIIVLTNAAERMPEAFHIRAYRFLSKPIKYDELKEAIQASVRAKIGYQRIDVLNGVSHSRIRMMDILYVKAAGSYLEIYTGTRKFTKNCSLKSMEALLENNYFSKCGRGIMINLEHVKSVKSRIIELDGGETLVSSLRCYKHFFDDYAKYDIEVRGVR